MALFIPGNPGLWLTPGSVLGLVAGTMLWLPLARCSPARSMRAAAICFAAGFLLVNLAPENPYLVAALQVWRHGHYVTFNGMTRLLSALWPFGTLAYLFLLAREASRGQATRGRRHRP